MKIDLLKFYKQGDLIAVPLKAVHKQGIKKSYFLCLTFVFGIWGMSTESLDSPMLAKIPSEVDLRKCIDDLERRVRRGITPKKPHHAMAKT